METANSKKPYKIFPKWFFRIVLPLLIFFMAFLIYYIAMSAYSTNKWIREINLKYAVKENEATDSNLLNDREYVLLQNRMAFAKARLKMAGTDSIGMTLNLSDSAISLDISGVTVRMSKIHRHKTSRSLYAVNHSALAKMLSNPLPITKSIATIVKEPIIDRKAPRDSTEVSLPEKISDTLKNEPVFFELTLENNIRLLVLQSESATRSEKISRFAFNLKRASSNTWKNLKSIIQFKIPEYSPAIFITVSGSDARAIYRAIPEKGMVSISFSNP